MRSQTTHLLTRWTACVGLLAVPSVTAPLAAQTTPTVFRACYVVATGTVYRIGEPGLPTECRTRGGNAVDDVEFSWTDAVGADHGSLSGLADDDHPKYLLVDGVRDASNGFAVTGTHGPGTTIPVAGAGTRLMWYPGKSAFRAGAVVGAFGDPTVWDDGNIGEYSLATGVNTRASGDWSTAMGSVTNASGVASTAMGSRTTASDEYSTAMGRATTASGIASTAMGGSSTASGWVSTAMGGGTTASGINSTAMGASSTASGRFSTAMGFQTTASGVASTAMGYQTIASGDYSTAMGRVASTNGHMGSFVFGDFSTINTVNVTADNSFVVRASGGTIFYSNSALSAGVSLAPGAGSWAGISDRNRKHLFRTEDGESVLAKIAGMPIPSWSYKAQDISIRHIGPTAQDFYAAFGLGESDTTITTTDIDGVNMLAVQALERRTRDLKEQLAERDHEIAELRYEVNALLQRLKRLEQTR
jgi:hypothetical protein